MGSVCAFQPQNSIQPSLLEIKPKYCRSCAVGVNECQEAEEKEEEDQSSHRSHLKPPWSVGRIWEHDLQVNQD